MCPPFYLSTLVYHPSKSLVSPLDQIHGKQPPKWAKESFAVAGKGDQMVPDLWETQLRLQWHPCWELKNNSNETQQQRPPGTRQARYTSHGKTWSKPSLASNRASSLATGSWGWGIWSGGSGPATPPAQPHRLTHLPPQGAGDPPWSQQWPCSYTRTLNSAHHQIGNTHFSVFFCPQRKNWIIRISDSWKYTMFLSISLLSRKKCLIDV